MTSKVYVFDLDHTLCRTEKSITNIGIIKMLNP